MCINEKEAHYQKWWIGHEMAINSLLSLLVLVLLLLDAWNVFVCTNKFYFWKNRFLLNSMMLHNDNIDYDGIWWTVIWNEEIENYNDLKTIHKSFYVIDITHINI